MIEVINPVQAALGAEQHGPQELTLSGGDKAQSYFKMSSLNLEVASGNLFC